jgi:hypothetical protein
MLDLIYEEETELEEEVDFIPMQEYLPNKYLSYRFKSLNIEEVTVDNYEDKLVSSLAEQVSMFIPPSGSFETPDLQRYLELVQSYETSSNDLVLGLSLADQIRITFSDMQPATICEKFPDIDLATKRRYRCVAEYLIRQEELEKVKDERGKLVKKVGNMGKLVVIYQPLEKVRKTLQRSGLTQFIKNDRSTQNAHFQTAADNANAD